MCGLLGHRRDQRHGGRAAADHDDPLALVVEVLGPVLRVDHLALEALAAGELGRVALVVAVVAAAHREEAAGEAGASRRCRCVRPRPSSARPAVDHCAETTRWLKRILSSIPSSLGGAPDVVEDRGAVGDRLRLGPRLEAEAERVHVGVRADARVAEEVPGAAEVARAPRGSRSSCRGSAPAGDRRRRCRKSRHRRSGRRRAQRPYLAAQSTCLAGQPSLTCLTQG